VFRHDDPLIGRKGEIIARPGSCLNLYMGTSIEKHERRERSFPARSPPPTTPHVPANTE